MGHTLICSYANEYIQYTPFSFIFLSLEKPTLLIQLCSYMFYFPELPNHLYIKLSAMHVVMFQTCIKYMKVNLDCVLAPFNLSSPYSEEAGFLWIFIHSFISECNMFLSNWMTEHPGTGNCMDVHPHKYKEKCTESEVQPEEPKKSRICLDGAPHTEAYCTA